MFRILNSGIGESIDDLKYNYTMDQIYLLYEKCERELLDTKKGNAVILANALIYASPSYEKKDASKKQQAWTKFINSLDYEKITERKDINKVKKEFLGLGLPIRKR